MGVILILGRPEDVCCQLVQEQLAAAGRDVWLLPEHDLLPEIRLTWKPSRTGGRGALEHRGKRARFADIDGVLCRGFGIPVDPESFETRDGQYISAEWNALLMAWLHQQPCPVINRLRPELWYRANLNVPDLVSLVPTLGFEVPRTLVTTVADEALAFCRGVAATVQYSPLTQPARYRIQQESEQLQLATLSGSLPLYLVAGIEGRTLDAFVVGSDVVLVDSDGRVDRTRVETVERACVEVGTALGITFYRLSLTEALNGAWYCLGLDRMPQLFGCGHGAQAEIVSGLVRLLGSGDRRS